MTPSLLSRTGASWAWRSAPVLALALTFAAPWSARFAAQPAESSEELARRFYETGLRFLRDGRPGEALKDLQRVVDAYPTSAVADDALLQIGEYQLTGGRDLAAARTAADALIAKYPAADTAPMAYVLAGRIGLAAAETVEGIDQALANFERVRTLFPRASAVSASLAYAGDAHRIARRAPEAVRAYGQAAREYPRAPWTARALLGLAAAQVAAGEPVRALEALSQLQATFPGAPEAAIARDHATMLYRLYLRAPAAPAFAPTERVIAGTAGRLDDVSALAVAADGALIVLQREGAMRYEPEGKLRDSARAVDARAVALLGDGQVVVGIRNGVQVMAGPLVTLALPRPEGTARPLDDLRAVVESRTGQWLVADGDTKSIARFAPDGKYAGPFASIDAQRLAVNDIGSVAALDRAGRTVAVLDASGKPLGRIGGGGAVTFQQAVDVAFDALGHLYVLDREAAAVQVFSPALQRVTTYTVSQKLPGAFRRATALAVDPAGRLFIYDDRAKSIRVHQ